MDRKKKREFFYDGVEITSCILSSLALDAAILVGINAVQEILPPQTRVVLKVGGFLTSWYLSAQVAYAARKDVEDLCTFLDEHLTKQKEACEKSTTVQFATTK